MGHFLFESRAQSSRGWGMPLCLSGLAGHPCQQLPVRLGHSAELDSTEGQQGVLLHVSRNFSDSLPYL